MDKIKITISDTKQKVLDRLDALEHALLSELSALHLAKSTSIEKQQSTLEIFVEKTNQRKNELDFAKEYGSNSQLFVVVQNLKSVTKEDKKSIKSLASSLKTIGIVYTPLKNPEGYLTTLGTLSGKQESRRTTKDDNRTPRVDSSSLQREQQRLSRYENVSLPTIESRQPSQLNWKPPVRSTPMIGHEHRSGRISRNSNMSSRSKYSSNSVNGCKTS